MIRKYHNHTTQTNLGHREEEPQKQYVPRSDCQVADPVEVQGVRLNSPPSF